MTHEIDSENITLDGRTYTIRVYPDDCTPSPLDNDEGVVFITYNKGSRYTLGNTQLEDEEHREIGARISAFYEPANAFAKALEGENVDPPLIGLKVYAYIHSGVHLSTRSFHGRLPQGHAEFDSAQSGFIYVTKETALEWQGGKRLTQKKIDAVLKSLESIVAEFGKWVNGECYYYNIESEAGDSIGGCGGFIGTDYMMEEARAEVKRLHAEHLKDKEEERYWLDRGVPTVDARA